MKLSDQNEALRKQIADLEAQVASPARQRLPAPLGNARQVKDF